jgi:hypothetical protein
VASGSSRVLQQVDNLGVIQVTGPSVALTLLGNVANTGSLSVAAGSAAINAGTAGSPISCRMSLATCRCRLLLSNCTSRRISFADSFARGVRRSRRVASSAS